MSRILRVRALWLRLKSARCLPVSAHVSRPGSTDPTYFRLRLFRLIGNSTRLLPTISLTRLLENQFRRAERALNCKKLFSSFAIAQIGETAKWWPARTSRRVLRGCKCSKRRLPRRLRKSGRMSGGRQYKPLTKRELGNIKHDRMRQWSSVFLRLRNE